MSKKIIGIIGAMQIETEMLINDLENCSKENISGTDYYSGIIDGKDVVVATCGIGKVNAACISQAMIFKYGITHIVNTGIAGAIDQKLNTCDVVISSDLVYHDVYIPSRDLQIFEADNTLMNIANKSCEINSQKYNFKYIRGRIASGDQFIDNAEAKNRIIELCNPACVEMEGAAIAHCASLNNIPFVVIRCMSDNADDDANDVYDNWIEKSAEISSSITKSLIREL